ncbi:MAG: NADH-quinone oxidoreductase subunit C [Candidatus Omnitrophota bacterium]|nr:NADH-quinone oxidoreductase subunit C [Candidatus Omnitrophota bacterium]
MPTKKEERIQSDLISKFAFLGDKVKVQRERRIFADVPAANFRDVLDYAVKELDFEFLCTMTGSDEGDNLGFMYHLARQDGGMLSLKITVPKGKGSIKTITDCFKGADIYEREVIDLLGAKVEGLPEGKRYPLPDDWPEGEYPLRKDWKKHA